ncbi:uncharacterized protein LOC125235275 [Leguminivora glycinivorella]|uniref:uncharacterized protein LOC125235275 n=1 Tax=Leguminivora glycinivorella TaxID=1035111 RepID=UPI00200EF5E1|nr:uncharacterized protein LOC125235275 [Leguminivora glycinivorella]
MHGEAPEFKRCCFCLPLRKGLIAWGYFKLLLNVLALIYVGVIASIYTRRTWRPVEARDIVILSFMAICLLVDMSFDIVFIAAGHKKDVKLLQISYIYNIVWLVLLTLGNCFQLYMNVSMSYRMWKYSEYRKYIVFDLLLCAGFAFGLIFTQIYLVLLIRSEIKKLRHQTLGMQFTNHAATGEPQCTLHNTECTDGKPAVHNCTEKQYVHNCCTEKQGVQNCCARKQGMQNCCTEKQAVQNCTGKKLSTEECCTDKNQGQDCCTNIERVV